MYASNEGHGQDARSPSLGIYPLGLGLSLHAHVVFVLPYCAQGFDVGGQ